MAITRHPDPRYDAESRRGWDQYVTRAYEIPRNATLADVSLERGDTLPDDSTYEIISADTKVVKDPKNAANALIAIATGVKSVVTTSGSTWNEIKGTRRVHDTVATRNYTITFEDETSAVSPKPGDKYRDIVGSGALPVADVAHEPIADYVSEVENFTVNKQRVTVVFVGDKTGA